MDKRSESADCTTTLIVSPKWRIMSLSTFKKLTKCSRYVRLKLSGRSFYEKKFFK